MTIRATTRGLPAVNGYQIVLGYRPQAVPICCRRDVLQAVGGEAFLIFGLAVLLVFLVLAAQYESWTTRWPSSSWCRSRSSAR